MKIAAMHIFSSSGTSLGCDCALNFVETELYLALIVVNCIGFFVFQLLCI